MDGSSAEDGLGCFLGTPSTILPTPSQTLMKAKGYAVSEQNFLLNVMSSVLPSSFRLNNLKQSSRHPSLIDISIDYQ